MKFFLKIVLLGLVILALSYFLPFVVITSYKSVLWFVIVVTVLNILLKPILVLLTIPVTIVTLGLFLLVINGIVILIADSLIIGIQIGNGLFDAIIFSILLSLANYIIEAIIE